jgi:sugar phosphate isomerase/epimerase
MNRPRLSVCEFTTLALGLEEELVLLRDAGCDGIGICEAKLPDGGDAEAAAFVRDSGLQASVCLPATLSVLPLTKFEGQTEPAARVAEMCAGVRRLAVFRPACLFVLTGPQGGLSYADARRIAVDGLRTVAETAADVGIPLGLEPIHASIKDDWTLVTTLAEAVELVEEVGVPGVGVGFDTWHLWDTPNLLEDIREHAARIVGVHVNDWRADTRGWNDRVLPGDGVVDLPAIFGALDAGGYDGWYDLEVLSDDGTFEDDYADSVWKLSPGEVVRRGREGFVRAWDARREPL